MDSLERKNFHVSTGVAWLSSARVVRCWVKSFNERNPYALKVYMRCCEIIGLGRININQSRLPAISGRKVGMTSSLHGPYELGYTRATMVMTKGRHKVTWSQSSNIISVRIGG